MPLRFAPLPSGPQLRHLDCAKWLRAFGLPEQPPLADSLRQTARGKVAAGHLRACHQALTAATALPEFVAVPASLPQSRPFGPSPGGHFVRFCTRFLPDCGFDSAWAFWSCLDRLFRRRRTQEKTVAAMPTGPMRQTRITHDTRLGI